MLLAAAGLPAYDAGKLNSGAGSGSVGSGGGGTPTTSSVASRPSAASALMKTLSVRLHRGTEFIKDTVQKALVMSAPTPVASAPAASVAPLTTLKIIDPQGIKRKLSGAGGLMGCSGISSITSISASTSRPHYILAPVSHSHVQVQPNVPTAAYLRTYTVAPTALHRSASARKRNPSTDSLLMDLCLFKPIRPMPITPIKINKFRGFELKRPKFVPATNPDSEEDEEDDDDESVHKPKLSNLTLPTNESSAFVPMPYIETANTAIIATNTSSSTTTTTTRSSRSRSRSHNTHTSGSAHAISNPKPKRRRRAPKLTIKRRRKAPEMKSTSPADGGTEAKVPAKRKAAAAATSGGASVTPPISSPAVVKKSAAKRKATSEGGHAKRSRGGSPPTITSTSSTDGATAVKSTSNRKSSTEKAAVALAKRSRGSSEASPPASRPSPPMTRQRARQQISASK